MTAVRRATNRASWAKHKDKRNAEQRRRYRERKMAEPNFVTTNNARIRAGYHKRRDRIAAKRVGLTEPPRPRPSVCECCAREPGAKGLHLDHDHITGNFRGWLCGECNLGLGKLGDNLAGVLRAAEYLRKCGDENAG